MRFFLIILFCISIFAKDTKTYIQVNIKDIKTFDFTDICNKYDIKLKYCVGKSICIFEMIESNNIDSTIKELKRYGKAKIYKSYKLKPY